MQWWKNSLEDTLREKRQEAMEIPIRGKVIRLHVNEIDRDSARNIKSDDEKPA